MKDNSLGGFFALVFGISGIVVILLAWFLPSLQSDRLTATLAGFVGIAVATISVRSMKKARDDEDETNAVPVDIKD